jgi:diaminohydroxyphosphoribosylaminopyrimidine deaminase/5-amino-6-(5-phosphoribosylamino)uracil reductase
MRRLTLAPLAFGGLGLAVAVAWMECWLNPLAVLAAYAAVAALVVIGVPSHAPHRHFGTANAITLTRAAFASLLVGLLAVPPPSDGERMAVAGLVLVGLALDGADGWAARRFATASRFGARFDMETDAFFILVLSFLAQAWTGIGAWVLAIGLMRYVFAGAGFLFPWLAAPLPDSLRRKAIAVLQVATLAAALLPGLPQEAASALCAAGLAALAASFAVDVVWLRRQGSAARTAKLVTGGDIGSRWGFEPRNAVPSTAGLPFPRMRESLSDHAAGVHGSRGDAARPELLHARQALSPSPPPGPAWWPALLARRVEAAAPWPEPRDTADGALLDLYRPLLDARAGGRFVLGHLGQSVDGHIATASGHSHYVTGRENLCHLHRLRALCDAVIVGAGTVRADDPRLSTRLVPGPTPVRVVLDPRRSLAADHALFQDEAGPTLLLCATEWAGRPAGRAQIVAMADLSPAAILGVLAARGLGIVFVEGGGVTVSRFLEAGALDRLHVAIAPVIIGSGIPALTLPPVARMDAALRPPCRMVMMGQDVLFDFDLRAPRHRSARPAPEIVRQG